MPLLQQDRRFAPVRIGRFPEGMETVQDIAYRTLNRHDRHGTISTEKDFAHSESPEKPIKAESSSWQVSPPRRQSLVEH
jgi:hypothetical protein